MRVNFKKKVLFSEDLHRLKVSFRRYGLHTVCEEARCPNISECFSNNHFTFLILGNVCTRKCRFCNVKSGKPEYYDKSEPERIARFVKDANLIDAYIVITSVTRDDLEDGGADIFARCVDVLKTISTRLKVELLTPDFNGKNDALKKIVDSGADLLGHNIETVRRLYPFVRPHGDYERGLYVIEYYASHFNGPVKSAIMVGLGETDEEIFETINDLRERGCSIVFIGQYFSPSLNTIPVARYLSDEDFKKYIDYGKSIGIKVVAGRFVRSSYRAGEIWSLKE